MCCDFEGNFILILTCLVYFFCIELTISIFFYDFILFYVFVSPVYFLYSLITVPSRFM